jgi:hypothetical protein
MNINDSNQVLDGSFTEMRELTENEIVQVSGGESHHPPQGTATGVDAGGGGGSGDH